MPTLAQLEMQIAIPYLAKTGQLHMAFEKDVGDRIEYYELGIFGSPVGDVHTTYISSEFRRAALGNMFDKNSLKAIALLDIDTELLFLPEGCCLNKLIHDDLDCVSGDYFTKIISIHAILYIKLTAIDMLKLNLEDTIGNIKNKQIINWLRSTLSGNKKDVLLFAIIVCAKNKDDDTLDKITRILRNHDDVRLKTAAAHALGIMGEKTSVEDLISVYQSIKSIKGPAIEALAEIGGDRAEEHILTCLQDQDTNIRKKAAIALDKLGYIPRDQVQIMQYHFAARNWDKLVETGDPAKEFLIAAKYGGLCDDDINLEVINCLERIGWTPPQRSLRIRNTRQGIKQIGEGILLIVIGVIALAIVGLARVYGGREIFIGASLIIGIPAIKYCLFDGIGHIYKGIMNL